MPPQAPLDVALNFCAVKSRRAASNGIDDSEMTLPRKSAEQLARAIGKPVFWFLACKSKVYVRAKKSAAELAMRSRL